MLVFRFFKGFFEVFVRLGGKSFKTGWFFGVFLGFCMGSFYVGFFNITRSGNCE